MFSSLHLIFSHPFVPAPSHLSSSLSPLSVWLFIYWWTVLPFLPCGYAVLCHYSPALHTKSISLSLSICLLLCLAFLPHHNAMMNTKIHIKNKYCNYLCPKNTKYQWPMLLFEWYKAYSFVQTPYSCIHIPVQCNEDRNTWEIDGN